MAGDYYCDRVVVDRHANGSAGFWAAYGFGDLFVGSGLTVWDALQLLPNGHLERGAYKIKLHIKSFALTSKIFLQLFVDCVGKSVGLILLVNVAAFLQR